MVCVSTIVDQQQYSVDMYVVLLRSPAARCCCFISKQQQAILCAQLITAVFKRSRERAPVYQHVPLLYQ